MASVSTKDWSNVPTKASRGPGNVESGTFIVPSPVWVENAEKERIEKASEGFGS